ncbi:MAG: peptidyl-prolyl cis-trans isomerase, partial [Rhizobiaceae bacterium]|nr:peptidyl-prolyl cis-trans isomerase [Rhizobiaceae bacterium]
PAADVLQTYFAANASAYRAPEYRGLAYATLTAGALSDPTSITDEAIAADYEQNAAQFTTPERRRIEQIVYPDRAAADAAKASLAAGKLFEQLIIESGRTVDDSLLGNLSKAEVPDPALADAAFALQPRAVSDVVDGAFGPVLMRVTEIQPEVKRPLEEVREELRRELALAAAADGVQQAYDAFEDARAGGSTMEEAALRAGLAVKTIPDVSLAGQTPDGTPVADLPASTEVLAGAFQTEVGFENPPIGLPDNGYLFYDVTKIDPARERTLDEVREQVLADWKRTEAARLLAERTNALKRRREAGETLDAIAASEGLTKDVANAITRITGTAQLGQAGVTAAYSGPSGTIATATAGDATSRLLLDVTDVSAPMDPVADLGPAEVEQLSTMIRTDFLQSYINLLQDDYDIVQYPAAIQAAQTLLR